MNPSDPIGKPGEKGALFARLNHRVFAKKDTIDLLRALLEFSSMKKRLVVYDKNDEYEFVRVRLECSPSKQQFIKKYSELKSLYLSRLSKGGGGGLTGDDAVVFELSEKLWSEEAMRQVKRKGRERSGRFMTLAELKAELGLGDARPLMEGDAQAESAGLRTESEVETGKSSAVASRKKKRKRKDESGKVGGTAEDDSGHEVLNDEPVEFAELAESSVKPRSEDGESGGKVRRKREKKLNVDDNSATERRSREERSGSEVTSKGNGNLAVAGNSRADFGQVDGSLASQEVPTTKEHKQVERPGELEKLSGRVSGNDDDCLARSAERGSADTQLDKGKSSRNKKKHKGGKTAEFKSLSDSGSGNEEVNDIDKASKSGRAKVESVSEDGNSVRSTSVKENKHKGDKAYDEKSEDGILSRKKKKKKNTRSTVFGGARPREMVLKEKGIDCVSSESHDAALISDRPKFFPRNERLPSNATTLHSVKSEEVVIVVDPRNAKKFERGDQRADDRNNSQKRNWRNGTRTLGMSRIPIGNIRDKISGSHLRRGDLPQKHGANLRRDQQNQPLRSSSPRHSPAPCRPQLLLNVLLGRRVKSGVLDHTICCTRLYGLIIPGFVSTRLASWSSNLWRKLAAPLSVT